MKKIISILTLISVLFAFTACNNSNNSDLEYVKNKGTLVVGVTDFEPLDYISNDEWTGFDAELARLVGENLGVSVQFQEINWKTKETELAGKTIDCIWNGLTWDSERAENMSLTDYYMINKQVLVIRSEDSDKYTAVSDFEGKNIAAESGSAGESLITESISGAVLIEKDQQIDALTELVAGTVVAVVIDFTMANYLINKEGSNFSGLKICDNILDSESEYYTIAFRKGSDLTAEVNKYLSELKESGKIAEIAEKYGLTDALVK